MVEEIISTGNNQLDTFLGGGIETDVLTTVYGPSGSGKTNVAMCVMVAVLRAGKKVIYIDTEASLSVARAKQLCPEFEKFVDQLIVLKPTNFEEQKKSFVMMKNIVDDDSNIGLVVVDSIAMLYRLAIGSSMDVASINRDLGVQLGQLTEIARKKRIPIVITNQVYADFENKQSVHMVGGDLLKYSSKCLLELKKFKNGVRGLFVVKHRSLPEGISMAFKIVQEGMAPMDMSSALPAEPHEAM